LSSIAAGADLREKEISPGPRRQLHPTVVGAACRCRCTTSTDRERAPAPSFRRHADRMQVVATAELIAVEGRTLSFRVEARDDKEPIGGGTHQRVVVNVARFDERVQRKLRSP
jgi:hypothetical protein